MLPFRAPQFADAVENLQSREGDDHPHCGNQRQILELLSHSTRVTNPHPTSRGYPQVRAYLGLSVAYRRPKGARMAAYINPCLVA